MPIGQIFIAFISLMIILVTSSCGEKSAAPTTTRPNETDRSILYNERFGMTFDAPDNWYVASDAQIRELMNFGSDVAAGDKDDLKAIIDASMQRNIPLFAVFEHEPGAPVEINPSIIAVAEHMAAAPGIKSGADYFFHAKKLMAQSTAQYAFDDEYKVRKFGEVSFDQMDLTITVGGQTVSQSYYAAKHDNYIVSVIASPNDAITSAVLENLKFVW